MIIELPLDADQQREIAARLFRHIEHHTTDVADGLMEVDPVIYTDPAVLAAEREHLFARVPIVAAHGSELPNPNDFVTVQLPNNEVVLVRQADGSVKAFVNVCRHRGARLVTDEAGSRRVFPCGYHGWVYNADGSLRSVANAQTFGPVDTSCRGLLEIPAEERHGCVWVVDSVGAEIDVGAWLGELDGVLGGYALDTYVCHRVGHFDEPINWKVLMDAFVDAYHIAATHRGTVAPHFYSNIQLVERHGRHCRMISPRRSIDRIRRDPPGAHPLDGHVTLANFVMPNLSFLRQPDHVEMLEFLPHPDDPERCSMSMRILVREGDAGDELAARWDKNWDILMAVLRDEDLVMNRGLQRAVGNGDVPTMVLGRNEVGNQVFHRFLQEWVPRGVRPNGARAVPVAVDRPAKSN